MLRLHRLLVSLWNYYYYIYKVEGQREIVGDKALNIFLWPKLNECNLEAIVERTLFNFFEIKIIKTVLLR